MASFDYDVVIIGSGYRVGVMESGRRWKDQEVENGIQVRA